jgi:hypothetical protein
MNRNTLFAIIVLFIVSCANDRTAEQENPSEQTPEVLNDEQKLDISSYSKRYGTDIIQELFDEAVRNDKDLKMVTSRLEQVKEVRQFRSLSDIHEEQPKLLECIIEIFGSTERFNFEKRLVETC